MLALLSCRRGHFWETTAEEGEAVSLRCPECGEPSEALPLLDLVPEAPPPRPRVVAAEPLPLLDAEGRPVLEGYSIREDLGRGPTGAHRYRAQQTASRREVLLTVVHAREDVTQQAWGALRGEARALACVAHPCFPTLYDTGQRDRQLFYNATSDCEGLRLTTFLQGLKRPLAPRQALRLVEVLARALIPVHEQGLLHRHLHPGCIILLPAAGGSGVEDTSAVCQLGDGYYQPLVRGLGLARKATDLGPYDVELVEGEPGYLSPEQVWGRSADLGPPTDVYGLGGFLYFLLTSRPPFVGPSLAETIDAIQSARLVRPSQYRRVPRDLERICVRCLAQQPRKRYRTTSELADDLRRARCNLPLRDGADGRWGRARKWARRQPLLTAMLALVLLTMFGAVWANLSTMGPATRDRGIIRQLEQNLERARREAEPQRAELESLRKAEQFHRYRESLSRAAAALAAKDTEAATRHLSDCDEKARGVEWYYLNRRAAGRPLGFFQDLERPARRGTVSSPTGEAAWLSGDARKRTSEVWIWSPGSGLRSMKLMDLRGEIHAARFSPDGRSLALVWRHDANNDGSDVQVYDLTRRGEERMVLHLRMADTYLSDLAFHPKGESLLLADTAGKLQRYRASDGEQSGSAFGPGQDATRRGEYRVAYRPDGEAVAVFEPGGDGASAYYPEGGQRVLAVRGAQASAVAYSREGLLAAAARDRTVTFFNADGEAEEATLQRLPGVPRRLAFSPDGRRLAVACDGGKVIVYGRGHLGWFELLTLDADGVVALGFTRNGWGLVTIGADRVATWGEPEG